MGIFIAVPPRDEQNQVMALLKVKTVRLTAAITCTHQEIALVREYRIRLIADVVTGKLDVREAANALPEIDPLEVEDELDDALDTGDEADLDELNEIIFKEAEA